MTEDHKFQVHCDASDAGRLHVKTSSLSIRVGQRVGIKSTEQMWDSILILCEETEDGTLSAKVIVCHPDWEQQLQVAHIQSCLTKSDQKLLAFELDLKAVRL